MQDSVKRLYHPGILETARGLYRCNGRGFDLLSESESFVYQFQSSVREADAPDSILRVTHSSHRSKKTILQELEWIQFIKQHGLSAAGPIPSVHNNLVETVKVGDSEFYLVSFERVSGRSAAKADVSRSEFLFAWGSFVGRMHEISAKNNRSGRDKIERPEWHEEWNVAAFPTVVLGQETVLARYREIIEEVMSLPKDEHYGIIHSDFEVENFFINDRHDRCSSGRSNDRSNDCDDRYSITAFDFDESQYHWFIYDIAVVIRTFTWTFPTLHEQESALNDFLEGYFSVYTISFEWLRQLPLFLRLREVCIYAYLHGKRNPSTLSSEESAYLESMRQRIEKGIPCLDIQL